MCSDNGIIPKQQTDCSMTGWDVGGLKEAGVLVDGKLNNVPLLQWNQTDSLVLVRGVLGCYIWFVPWFQEKDWWKIEEGPADGHQDDLLGGWLAC